MRIFVYEELTARGIGRAPDSAGHGMYLEGRAMRDAIVEDFSKIAGLEVVVAEDGRSSFSKDSFERNCRESDWTFLIAPELDGRLLTLAQSVNRAGGRLLGPSEEAIRLTSDKLKLFEHWRTCGVPTPATTEREPGLCEAFPVVWKPRDGAGSTLTLLLQSSQDVIRARAIVASEQHVGPMILQEYVPGTPASVSFLCGPKGRLALAPARQLLSSDGRFHYLGGETPLAPGPADRGVELARRAIEPIPELLGIVGIDLVLGAGADGSKDYAIEVNPRLTTSYLGLRKLTDTNLAEALVQIASGGPIVSLNWQKTTVHFVAGGGVPDC